MLMRSGKAGRNADAAAAAAKVMRKLGKAKAANMFAHMRKVAQHPLLVRRLFPDKQVAAIAKVAYSRSAPWHPCHIRMHVYGVL
jgi:hypothetical protein